MCIRDSINVEGTLNGRATIVASQKNDANAGQIFITNSITCLLYTSDAADERSSVDLGGRRIIKKKTILRFSRVTQRTT